MGKTRCSSFPLRPPQTRLSPTLQRTPKVVQDTMHHQQLQRSRQKQCLIDFYSKPSHKKRYREGKQGRQSRILQPTFPSSQTRKPVETHDRPQFFKSVSHGLKIQNGNPRIHTRIAETRGMGYLYRPLGCLPSSSHPSTIKEIPQVPPPREFLPIHQLAVRASHSPKGVHVPGKGGKTIGTKTRHPVAPIPGRLADQSTFPGRIKGAYCQPPFPDPITGLHSKSPEVRASTPTEVQIYRVPFFIRSGSCQAHTRQMGQNSELLQQDLKEVCYQCKDSYVHHWITSIRREDGETGQDPYETFSMASKDSLEIPNASEFSHSLDSDNETTRGMVVRPTTRIMRRILTPQGPRRSDLYRRIKRRLGRTLRSRLRRRPMVSHRATAPHQRPRIKSCNPSPQTLLRSVHQETGVGGLRQHNSSSPHKQTRRNPLARTLCSHVASPHMVQQTSDLTQSATRAGLTQCHCGWPLQEKPNPAHRMVSVPPDLQTNCATLGAPTDRPVCHQAKHKTPNLRFSRPRPSSMGSGCTEHLLEEHSRVCLPSNSSATQGGPKITLPVMPTHSHSPGLANKTVVLGPGGTVSRSPKTTPTNPITAQTTTEQPIPHSPGIPQPSRLVSRSTILQNQGFTAEVADRIAAPQRLSTRAIYASKWAVFQRWCAHEQVDFRAPSIKDICNFMCFLFKEKKRRPSTIEGYRTAIADTLGNTPLDISNNPEIARLIASFHRDKPKASRSIPTWNLSLVLHQLKQPPFEPLEEASLKYATWKTVFLLALASGKRRSEIHAWTMDGLLCLGDWDQIQLTPSPIFIAKNQLAREGTQTISPVVIPALKTTQDDRDTDILLCPVRALSIYLKLTAELRQDKTLLFISYKQGHSKDILCSTISSWIKNTVKFCYSKAGDTDMDSLGVRAHDVRAFAASKAFYGGVSMDQILQACHWKSHNTFTSFYLKDLSGQNQKDLSYHLGSFVAAQRVMPPS